MRANVRHFTPACLGQRVHFLLLQSNQGTALWLGNCQSNRMNRTTTHAGYDGSDDLHFYIHDGTTSFRFDIEGSLSGNSARELEQCGRTASSVIGNRSLVISVGNVNRIDPFGRALLRRLHEAGARFVAKSPLAKTLVGSITGQPVISETAATKYDTWLRFRAYALPLIPLITLFCPATVNAASLEPATSKAWEDYIESANVRMEQRLSPGNAFLWVDEVPDRCARVRAGEIIVSPVGPQNPKRVVSGLIHDWVAAVFIAHVKLNDVLQVVRDYARYREIYQPTVIDSKAIATGEAKDRFSMLLANRSFFLKTALDTDYESCEVHLDDRRVYSVSRTTRIQEIEEYGTPAQRILHEGEGNGIIWRLFWITRYVERDGGVYLELEAIGLSRDIPASLRWAVEPIVRRVSRRSLSTSLRQTENAVRIRAVLANRKTGNGSICTTARRGTAIHDLRAAHSCR
jgi:hypothetical protein